MSLPQIQVSPKLYSILKIVFLTSAFVVIAFNVISAHATVPPNTTDWNWGIVEGINGSSAYPDDYYNEEGIPNELIDDDLEEDEEEQDEQEHEEESKEEDD